MGYVLWIDMKAGSPAQMAYLKDHVAVYNPKVCGDYYTWASLVLENARLNPDPSYLYEGKPYHYGSAWLKETIPADAIKEIESLFP